MTDSNPALQLVERFPSLAAMSNTHRGLLKHHREQSDAPAITAEIEQFMLKGRATGALLDDEDDRWVAQGLLDYWTTKVYRTGYEPPDSTLDDFDPDLAPELADGLCPYVGLDAFREADSDVFFGRAALMESALKILKEKRLLAVVGPSGAGKSSLVMAGLLPKLKTGALSGSDTWRYFKRIVPGHDPLHDLAHIAAPKDADNTWIERQVETFLQSPSHLTLLLEQANTAPAVVIVDQFEEIFTLCSDENVRMAFINNLIGLVQSPNARHLVLLTMRADFQSQVSRIAKLQALFNDGALTITSLNASELRDTIVKPAELIGLKFEDGLVDELVRDVLGESAALPLLQFTLFKLWEKRERNRLVWSAYQKMGGGRKALGYSADEFYNSLIPEEQVTCKRILLKIVRPGEGLEVTSNRVFRTSIYRAGEARDRVDRVLDRLLKARLLLQTEGDQPGEEQIEVAHEALVRNWPQLVEWLDEERQNLRSRLRLTAAAKQWKQLGKEKGTLLRGVMLHIVESYDDLSDLEKEFVQASRDAQEATRKQKEQQRQRELEQAQELAASRQRELEQAEALATSRQRELEQAEALAAARQREIEVERQRTEIMTRTAAQLRRRSVFLVVALGFALVFAGAAALFARESFANLAQADLNARQAALNAQQAQEQAATANAASTEAVANEQIAIEAGSVAIEQQRTAQAASTQAFAQKGTAVAEANAAATARADALYQSGIAFSRQLAAQSANYLESKSDLGLLLGVEAYRTYDTLEAQSVLLAGLQRNLGQLTVQLGRPLLSPDGYINSVTFSKDGKTLAVGTANGAILLWDVAKRTLISRLTGHTAQVYSLSFSPDGITLASGSADGTIIFWDYAAGLQTYRTPQTEFGMLSIAFNPDGQTLAVGRTDSRIELLDVAAREQAGILVGHRDRILSVAWSPDGKLLASGSADSTGRVWDPANGKLVTTLRGHTRAIRSIIWTPDGKQLVTASQDNRIIIWDAATGLQSGDSLNLHDDQVLSLAFARDGKTLASGGADRNVILWDFPNRRPIDILRDHSHWVISVAFSPDGKTLASGGIDETTVLREIVVKQQLGESLSSAQGAVYDASLLDNGTAIIAVRSSVGGISFWDFTANTRLAQPEGRYETVALSHDATLAALTEPARIVLYDLTAKKPLPITFQTQALGLTFSPDNKLLAVSVCDATDEQGFCPQNTVQIWDAQTGQLARSVPTSHTDYIWTLAFSADGKMLATGGQDNTIILWDTATWSPLGLPLTGHTNYISSLAFNPDGKTLASGSADGKIILWDLYTLLPIGQPLTGHRDGVFALAFSPNGTSLISGGEQGDIYLWATTPTIWQQRACELAKRNLTHAEWEQFLTVSGEAYRKTCDQWPEGE